MFIMGGGVAERNKHETWRKSSLSVTKNSKKIMRSDGWFQVQWNPKNAFFQGLELGLIQKSHQANTPAKKGSSI
jgi:hypothetical protein